MTPAELIVRLGAIRGACPLTLTARTVPDMRVTGNPYRDCKKIAVVNGMIGWHYAAAVNRQRLAEGNARPGEDPIDATFRANPRKWGERIRPFIVHKGRVHLEIKRERVVSEEYRTAAGELIPEAALKPWLKKKRSCADHQGVDREIVLRDYAIDNIVEISFAGQRHAIEHETRGQRSEARGQKKTRPRRPLTSAL